MSDIRDDSLDAGGDAPRPAGRFAGAARRVGVLIAVALAVFLAGLVPACLKARENARQRDAAQRELSVSRMQNALASAAVDAARGEYEPARQSASEFFTALHEQVHAADGQTQALSAAQRDSLRPLLAQRDELITLLARGDPAAAPRLSDMHAAFRKAVPGAAPPEGQR